MPLRIGLAGGFATARQGWPDADNDRPGRNRSSASCLIQTKPKPGDTAHGGQELKKQRRARGEPMRDGEFAGDPDAAARQPREVFLFFDNTDKRHAPADASSLMRMLDLSWNPEEDEQAA